MEALGFTRDRHNNIGGVLIQNRRLTITTTINDKLATIKIVKNWKVCFARQPGLAGAILQMFWSVKQHNKNVKCVETTLTKVCNQSNHSMKSYVIKISICLFHWSSLAVPGRQRINLIKSLPSLQSVILPVLVSICLIYGSDGGDPANRPNRVDIITRCVTTHRRYICLAQSGETKTISNWKFCPFLEKLFSFVQVQWHNNCQPPF